MSAVLTGWGWSSGPSKCDSPVANEQIIVLALQESGFTIRDETIQAMGDGAPPISLDEFDKLIQMELTLHRERKYDADIKKRYCSVELSFPKAPGMQDENVFKKISYLNVMTLLSLAGTIDYSIQITDDGTELVTGGE